LAPYGVTVKTNGGSASRGNDKTTSLTWNNLLTWDKTFGDHSINLLAGHEFYSRNFYHTESSGQGIMEIGRYELESATKDWRARSWHDPYALLSFFGQAQYNYKGRYYASASVRRDGSSRFHPDRRWGNFFSAGASWRLSHEAFLSDISWLNNMSLRASYGTTGNDDIGTYYAYQAYYSPYNLYGEPGLRKKSNAADNLHWEENKQINAAVDFSIFNRVSGTIEYYRRNSNGLLAEKDIPFSANAGAGKINTNLGDILNTGVELSATVAIVRNKDFQWNITANLTTLHNEITSLPGGAYIHDIYRTYAKKEVGHSVMEHFVPKTAGVDPEDGMLQYWVVDSDGNWSITKNSGDVSTARDGQYAGSAIPKGYGSITNSFNYKGFDFSFMFYGSYGSVIYSYQMLESYSVRAGVSPVPSIVDGARWTKPGDNAQLPRWSMRDRGIAGQNINSDLFIVKNDFLRLRNLTLGYTLPKSLLQKADVSNVRLYITGDNLLTFSPTVKYSVDPEQGLRGNDYNGNGDNDSGIQGARRVFMGGIQLSF
jgi:TonB-linked SusC/RagA family outer membrane protein